MPPLKAKIPSPTGSLLFNTMVEDEDRPILIAESDPEFRGRLAESLREAGFQVLEARDGREALETARKKHPGLIICDRVLASLDGLDLCRRVKNDPALCKTFIILLLPGEPGRDLSSMLDAGADECLPRSCTIRDILPLIRAGRRVSFLQNALASRNEDFQQLKERLQRELEVVSGIQKAMLPQELPRTPAYDFTAFYMPSTECGGDYYDLVQLDSDCQGLVIADVSGHGAPATVTMALARQNFHLISQRFDQPHLLLEEMNRLLFDHLPTDQYVTMHYSILNTRTLTCQYASAGHNPPFWYRARPAQTQLLAHCEGFPLKLVTRDATYESHTIQLESNDRIVYYTDGIPECFGPGHQIYGMERFARIVDANAANPRVAALENTILTDVLGFAENQSTEDDITLAIVGVH